jgi:hypothetical protein
VISLQFKRKFSPLIGQYITLLKEANGFMKGLNPPPLNRLCMWNANKHQCNLKWFIFKRQHRSLKWFISILSKSQQGEFHTNLNILPHGQWHILVNNTTTTKLSIIVANHKLASISTLEVEAAVAVNLMVAAPTVNRGLTPTANHDHTANRGAITPTVHLYAHHGATALDQQAEVYSVQAVVAADHLAATVEVYSIQAVVAADHLATTVVARVTHNKVPSGTSKRLVSSDIGRSLF